MGIWKSRRSRYKQEILNLIADEDICNNSMCYVYDGKIRKLYNQSDWDRPEFVMVYNRPLPGTDYEEVIKKGNMCCCWPVKLLFKEREE